MVTSSVLANRGDEAMLRVVVGQLRLRGVDPVTVLYSGQDSLSDLEASEEHRDLAAFFASSQCYQETMEVICLLARHEHVLVIGADVLDGTYGVGRTQQNLRLLEFADRLGLSARICGFSVSDVPAGSVAEAYRSVPDSVRLFVRDPLSRSRLEQLLPGRCEQVADLAFLLEPADPEEMPADLRMHLVEGPPPIAFCASRHLMGEDASRQDALADAAGLLAERLESSILLVPHHPGDLPLLDRMRERIEQVVHGRAYRTGLLPAAVVKRVLGSCRHVISGRMHTSIAALGMARPVTCLPYRGKFRGMLSLFDLDDAVLDDAEVPHEPASICDVLTARVSAGEAEISRITDKLEGVRELALRNFDGLDWRASVHG
ncbi:MAG: polysaccharide pyruvyl transferase family protein [Planctomycetota bacterium]